jgi:coenzyme F420-dependent glucose-6-phosphate dehydrogenase
VPEIGYTLSSEEQGPSALVEQARRAEAAGFESALLSDHFHPWIPRQGESPFAWTTLGGVATATEDLRVGTGVTCPIQRLHPAIVAQAAATTAALFDGRFFLGVGTGENLNEHVTGERWPPFPVRAEMLEEAVDVIRSLWTGEEVDHHGEHFTVENATLFTLPEEPPPLHVAGSGTTAASLAGEIGDGLVSTAPDEEVVGAFEDRGDGPRYGQLTVCYAETEREARETAREWWPNAALPGELGQVLPTPAHFEQAVSLVSEADVAERVVCGPGPDDYVENVEAFAEAGFDHVYFHQVGPDQAGFVEFYEEELRHRLE